jgi:hypothetical protein
VQSSQLFNSHVDSLTATEILLKGRAIGRCRALAVSRHTIPAGRFSEDSQQRFVITAYFTQGIKKGRDLWIK